MTLQIDEDLVNCLMVWARTYTINPRLEFRETKEGHTLCDVFSGSLVGDMSSRCLPLATTRVR